MATPPATLLLHCSTQLAAVSSLHQLLHQHTAGPPWWAQVLCGAVTDQCVEHAVRDAADANFLVTMVTGA